MDVKDDVSRNKGSKGEPVQFAGGFFDGGEEKALEGLAAARVDPSAFGVVRVVGMMMTRQEKCAASAATAG